MTLVYLGLGTNLGDRRANLEKAIKAINQKMIVLRKSSVYETKAWGYTEQPDFLNQVIEVSTDLSPLSLLNFLKRTETELGRVENFRYGPRLIDVDILFYGELIRNTARLQIPHPKLHERAFVLVPMAELEGEFVHPVLEKTIAELLENVDASEVRLCE
ncbi:MAG: 2-amino-4-hydroxy-6-hydroxymethyldihydropteridine diphosphokinase [Chloroflexi bacterium]|jgi:2-amino-4-hydroxy-6-hydroxymethyldihydropteridine diphosphokinase|nr:2-amino-4-hydroxy-6-hydroxymethyldihydropteridine diphosphokinase [Chloroflexota bacterium]